MGQRGPCKCRGLYFFLHGGVWEKGAEENIGSKRDEVTGKWRKLHNEELNDLYCSSDIIRVIKSRRMRRLGPAAGMGRGEGHTVFCW